MPGKHWAELNPQPSLTVDPGNILCGKVHCNPTDEKGAQKGKGYTVNSKAGLGACVLYEEAPLLPFTECQFLNRAGRPGGGKVSVGECLQ